MKKWIIRIGLVLLVILAGLIITTDILHDYPEKFKIKGAEVALFKVDGQNSSGCYVLSDSIGKNDTSIESVFLIGIRFKLDYVSVKREHLWDDSHSPDGALGHLDMIRAFNVFNAANKVNVSDSLTNAAPYEDFYKDNLNSREGHHGNQKGCYVAQIFEGLSAFSRYYNENASTYNMVSKGMNDYLLFKINNSLVPLILANKITVSLIFTDGKIIEQKVSYKAQ